MTQFECASRCNSTDTAGTPIARSAARRRLFTTAPDHFFIRFISFKGRISLVQNASRRHFKFPTPACSHILDSESARVRTARLCERDVGTATTKVIAANHARSVSVFGVGVFLRSALIKLAARAMASGGGPPRKKAPKSRGKHGHRFVVFRNPLSGGG